MRIVVTNHKSLRNGSFNSKIYFFCFATYCIGKLIFNIFLFYYLILTLGPTELPSEGHCLPR